MSFTAPTPSRTTVVHLLRHGEVDNPRGILYGRLPDYHLSARGHEMARVVALHLAASDITHLVSSPLERARETVAPLAETLGLPVTVDERVIEAANELEGKAVTPRDLAQPQNWPLFRNPFRPSWGEPYREIARRMEQAVHAARRSATGHEALIVSHQLPIWTMRRHVEGRRLWHDPRNRECSLASLTSLYFTGDEITQIVYSEPAARLVDETTASVGA